MERMKQVNPTINAMAQDRFKQALEEAERIDQLLAAFRSGKPEAEFSSDELEMLRSPLLGIPISVKESIMVKGMKNSCGIIDRKDVLATEDAVVVKNAKRFGMVPICTTNIPEGTLFWADCQNKVYGRTLNPYDLSRITGASSGGEGSLQAAAGSLIGIGSDLAGSLRLPAHFSGIHSHKPSPFLLSSEGNWPAILESRLRLFTFGPMSRYVSDLRPLFKCLMSDKDNAKQDTYYKYQPENIATIRQDIIKKLDDPIDISQLKIFYFNFNTASQLKANHSVHVSSEIMDAQQEILDHFRSKFNCQVEHVNLDKYLKKTMVIWQSMVRCGGTIDRDETYQGIDEVRTIFGINNMFLEFLKLPLGASKHTKESLLGINLGSVVPNSKEKAYPMCEKFEKVLVEMKTELEGIMGDNGILIMPTMPTVAMKHNVALIKTPHLRFTALFNVLQFPVTHVTLRLDKKHKLPYGFSVAAKPYHDPTTLAVAEEIELAFGGWTPPTKSSIDSTVKLNEKHAISTLNNNNVQQQEKS